MIRNKSTGPFVEKKETIRSKRDLYSIKRGGSRWPELCRTSMLKLMLGYQGAAMLLRSINRFIFRANIVAEMIKEVIE
jgi:hypothetical protein